MPDKKVAMAIHAHPDDIDFMMAGTLLMLGRAGYHLHYMNVASGSGGSLEFPAAELREIRAAEARAAATVLGATFHPSLRDDLEVVYDVPTLRELAAVIRQVGPNVLLVPSPQDYMEDHTNVCRLAVTAAFARAIKNFATDPPSEHTANEMCVYHAMPHGLCDPLRKRVLPGAYVNTTPVIDRKRQALGKHASQGAWLDATQGQSSYLATMDAFSRELGTMSGRFEHAEGWRRHLHYGFGAEGWDPIAEALGDDYSTDESYESQT
ncbi:PIG-L family deacetylase [soil metagenome]